VRREEKRREKKRERTNPIHVKKKNPHDRKSKTLFYFSVFAPVFLLSTFAHLKFRLLIIILINLSP
jgi:hypothetical protein